MEATTAAARSLPARPVGDARTSAAVIREVASDAVDRIVFAATALVAAFAYSVLLPFGSSQRISLANWRYLDLRYVAFSIGFAVAIAWLVTLQVHAVRRIVRDAASERAPGTSGPLAALGGLVSLLPSLLCCSPILPTLVGLIGLSAGSRLRTTVSVQNFFATKENLILAGALVLMSATAAWSTRKVVRATCLGEYCAVERGVRDRYNVEPEVNK